jgi:hypothetical protein
MMWRVRLGRISTRSTWLFNPPSAMAMLEWMQDLLRDRK